MTFKGMLLAAATLGGVIIAIDGASAASPAYCALYSREYALNTVQPTAAPAMLQSIQDQAYFRCLNMDQDPSLPQTSAYAAPSPGATTTIAGTTGAAPSGAGAPIETASVVPPIPRPAPAAAPKTIVTASVPNTGNLPTVAATTPNAPKATVTTANAASNSTGPLGYHPSGKPQGSDEWKAYCAKWFPNSWDPETGTILRVGASSREVCR